MTTETPYQKYEYQYKIFKTMKLFTPKWFQTIEMFTIAGSLSYVARSIGEANNTLAVILYTLSFLSSFLLSYYVGSGLFYGVIDFFHIPHDNVPVAIGIITTILTIAVFYYSLQFISVIAVSIQNP